MVLFRESVSIPFKREGISERVLLGHTVFGMSLFPFPSTGKAFPNYTEEQKTAIAELGFHSLQPGRHFRTNQLKTQSTKIATFPFPSTGTAFPN